MDDLIDQLIDLADGLDLEAITLQVEQCANIPADKVPAVSAWIASLVGA